MVKVTRVMRAATRARLADDTTGFNPLLTASLADMSIEAPTSWRLPIVYDDPSRNFFMADIEPDDFKATTSFTWPFQTLFAMQSENQNKAKFHAMAGPINLGLNTYVTWPAVRALTEMELVCDAIEESLYAAFNAAAIAEWAMQYDHRLGYNGEFSIKRSRVQRSASGEIWSQALYGVLVMDLFDNG